MPGVPGGGLGGFRPPSGPTTFNSTQPVLPNIDWSQIDPATQAKVAVWLRDHAKELGSGLSDLEKWAIGLQAVGGAFGAYTNYKQGQQQNALSQAELQEKIREFDALQKTQAAQAAEQQRQFNIPQAVGLSRMTDLDPMRDRAAYLLSARLGQTPTPFQGATINNPSGSPGGIDYNTQKKTADNYTQWAGGTKPGSDLRKKILESLGYGS